MNLNHSLPRIDRFPSIPARQWAAGKPNFSTVPVELMQEQLVEVYGKNEVAKVDGWSSDRISAVYSEVFNEDMATFSLIRLTPAFAQVQALVDSIERSIRQDGRKSLDGLTSPLAVARNHKDPINAFIYWVNDTQEAHRGFIEEALWISGESIKELPGEKQRLRNAILLLIMAISLQYVGNEELRSTFTPYLDSVNAALASFGLNPLSGAFSSI